RRLPARPARHQLRDGSGAHDARTLAPGVEAVSPGRSGADRWRAASAIRGEECPPPGGRVNGRALPGVGARGTCARICSAGDEVEDPPGPTTALGHLTDFLRSGTRASTPCTREPRWPTCAMHGEAAGAAGARRRAELHAWTVQCGRSASGS